MENNYDTLKVVFEINKHENKEVLLKFAYDYYSNCDDSIERSLIKGWNSYITLNGDSYRYLPEPSKEFLSEVNRLYKVVRRQQIISKV